MKKTNKSIKRIKQDKESAPIVFQVSIMKTMFGTITVEGKDEDSVWEEIDLYLPVERTVWDDNCGLEVTDIRRINRKGQDGLGPNKTNEQK